jgi:hypothetical protein
LCAGKSGSETLSFSACLFSFPVATKSTDPAVQPFFSPLLLKFRQKAKLKINFLKKN